jgi:hypothetical protein
MKRFAPSFGWNPADKSAESAAALIAAATAGQPLASPEPIRCSLVTERVVEDGGQEFRQDGYSLVLEGVGTVHLAEMLIKPGLRRINMLRIELRKSSLKRPSARGGFRASADRDGETYNATVCSGEGNGSNSYP